MWYAHKLQSIQLSGHPSVRNCLVLDSLQKAGDDEKPPGQLSGLAADEKRLKEAEVFDAAIADLCSTHWKDATFDKCSPVPVSCIGDLPLHTYSDHEDVHSFLVNSLRDIRTGKFEKIKMEIVTHVQRYRNELIFLKSLEPGCPHCSEHPVRAKKLSVLSSYQYQI